jgi:hypothetical protein
MSVLFNASPQPNRIRNVRFEVGGKCYVNGFFRGLSPAQKVGRARSAYQFVAPSSYSPDICYIPPPLLREPRPTERTQRDFLYSFHKVLFFVARCRLKLSTLFL